MSLKCFVDVIEVNRLLCVPSTDLNTLTSVFRSLNASNLIDWMLFVKAFPMSLELYMLVFKSLFQIMKSAVACLF